MLGCTEADVLSFPQAHSEKSINAASRKDINLLCFIIASLNYYAIVWSAAPLHIGITSKYRFLIPSFI